MAGAKLSHNSYGPARVWTPMQTRSKAAAAAKNAAAATPSPSRRAVISIDEGDKDFMSSDDANSDEDGGSDLGGETDEYDDDGDIGLGDDDDDRDLHGTGWMSEEMQTLIWDNVAYCLQREVPVSIASSSHEKLQVEFSDLPTAARTLYNWPSSCMVFRLTFGAGLMKHHTHPTVSIQTPDGRHWLGGAALGTAHAAHAESGVYHLKALLSLIALDLEVLWPMHSATDVHQRVLTRISATADAAQEKVFQVDEALCQINVESSVQEIIKHTQSVANATGGNKSCRLGRLVESMWHNVMQLRSRCFVCGAPHPAASVVHHPQACVKALCRFNYTVDCMRYGELLPAIRQRPQVVDLLMTLAVTACESSRKASIFTPAPVDFISGQCQKKAAGGLVTVDYLKLADHMRIFPPVAKMLECENEGELLRRLSHTYPWKSCDIALSCKEQEALAKAAEREITEGDVALGHRLYRLLWWIITNIVDSIDYVEYSRLPAAVTCAIGTTPRPSGANGYNANNESKSPASRLVFKTTSLCAVLSTAFRKHADKHGVFQVYHGSSLENWYSILKHGLRNMSGSGYQVNGASYGSGIYLGKDWKTSKGYTAQGVGTSQVPVSPGLFPQVVGSARRRQPGPRELRSEDLHQGPTSTNPIPTCHAIMCSKVRGAARLPGARELRHEGRLGAHLPDNHLLHGRRLLRCQDATGHRRRRQGLLLGGARPRARLAAVPGGGQHIMRELHRIARRAKGVQRPADVEQQNASHTRVFPPLCRRQQKISDTLGPQPSAGGTVIGMQPSTGCVCMLLRISRHMLCCSCDRQAHEAGHSVAGWCCLPGALLLIFLAFYYYAANLQPHQEAYLRDEGSCRLSARLDFALHASSLRQAGLCA